MIRYQLFTWVTLVGCLAPWLTPRLYPDRFQPNEQEPAVAAWVVQDETEGQLPKPDRRVANDGGMGEVNLH